MRAVIFDFDGLVVDSETPAYEAWSSIYQEHGCHLSLELWVQCVGSSTARFDPVEHLAKLTGLALDRTQLLKEKERRKYQAVLKEPLMPGVTSRILEARSLGLATAIASSSDRSWVGGHAQRLGIVGLFDVIRTADEVTRIKPFPDLYLSVAKALDVEPSACLVFEDSLNGVKAAKAAGMWCFAVPNRVTAGLDFREADGVLSSLDEKTLGELIQNLAS